MENPKTDKSVKAGLQIEGDGFSSPGLDKEKAVSSSYDKDYEKEIYNKDEASGDAHYDKDADAENS